MSLRVTPSPFWKIGAGTFFVGHVSCRPKTLSRVQFYLSEPESRALSDVEHFRGPKERREGSEVAFDRKCSHEATHLHLPALPVAVAFPGAPAEVRGGGAHFGGEVEERPEAPVDLGPGDMEPGELQGPAEHEEDQSAEVRLLEEPAADLEPGGSEEAEDGFPLGKRLVGRDEGRQGAENGGGAAFRVDFLPSPGDGGFRPVQHEGEAAGSEAGSGHTFDREQGVGLEIGRLTEEKEIEGERIARRELPGFRGRLEDVWAWRRGKAAEERWRLALDEGLEEPGVDAGSAQQAVGARLGRTHGADRAAQGVAEGSPEERALEQREAGGLQGTQGEAQAQVGDPREEVASAPRRSLGEHEGSLKEEGNAEAGAGGEEGMGSRRGQAQDLPRALDQPPPQPSPAAREREPPALGCAGSLSSVHGSDWHRVGKNHDGRLDDDFDGFRLDLKASKGDWTLQNDFEAFVLKSKTLGFNLLDQNSDPIRQNGDRVGKNDNGCLRFEFESVRLDSEGSGFNLTVRI